MQAGALVSIPDRDYMMLQLPSSDRYTVCPLLLVSIPDRDYMMLQLIEQSVNQRMVCFNP
jgi:hypothetical protein